MDYRELSRMSDRELRKYRRELRLRRERARRARICIISVIATVILVLAGTMTYGSIKTKANTGYKYYTKITVNAGDTLWSIAEDNIDYNYYKNLNSYIKEVKNINHLQDENNLISGEIIVIPYYSAEFVY